MIQRSESYYAIEALENAKILVINYNDWVNLSKKHHSWDMMAKSLIESAYMQKEIRERELLLDDAKTRYQNFIKRNPQLVPRLKQHQIASYLGITAVALSRIKAKMLT